MASLLVAEINLSGILRSICYEQYRSNKSLRPNAMQDMWHKIVSEFFPTSGYQPTYEMDIEAYTEGNMGSPDYRSEIWVPVIKK